VSVYKEVFVSGYYRKDGSFVRPHIRKIKVSKMFGRKAIIKSYNTADINQLALNFSGLT
jgi:hypothetical protein|tara:strand:- start:283 stop:459 length:177 start_codon:yes stop_codon:yes gene_type:complete